MPPARSERTRSPVRGSRSEDLLRSSISRVHWGTTGAENPAPTKATQLPAVISSISREGMAAGGRLLAKSDHLCSILHARTRLCSTQSCVTRGAFTGIVSSANG